MKIKNIVIFFLIGYLVAMLYAKWFPKKKDKKKLTLIGIIGSVATAQMYPNVSALCGGLALYETGEEAGLSVNNPTDDKGELKGASLGKINDSSLAYETNLKIGDYNMQVFVSKWFEPYEYAETANGKDYILRPTMWRHVKEDYEEKGIYFIREIDTKNIVYIGKSGAYTKNTSKPRQSFDRLYRHFQRHNPSNEKFKAINHPTFNGEDYEVRVIQVFYPTQEKLKALETFYNEKYKPYYSYGVFDPFQDEDEPEYSTYENVSTNTFDDLEEAPF